MGISAGRHAGSASPNRRDVWLAHLRRCRARGQSLKAYAEAHGLGLSTLYSWQARLKAEGLLGGESARTFVRVEPSAAAPVPTPGPGTGPHRLAFPNGLVLEWQGAADLRLIGQLLRLEGGRP
jgi:hypothetical protein